MLPRPDFWASLIQSLGPACLEQEIPFVERLPPRRIHSKKMGRCVARADFAVSANGQPRSRGRGAESWPSAFALIVGGTDRYGGGKQKSRYA